MKTKYEPSKAIWKLVEKELNQGDKNLAMPKFYGEVVVAHEIPLIIDFVDKISQAGVLHFNYSLFRTKFCAEPSFNCKWMFKSCCDHDLINGCDVALRWTTVQTEGFLGSEAQTNITIGGLICQYFMCCDHWTLWSVWKLLHKSSKKRINDEWRKLLKS